MTGAELTRDNPAVQHMRFRPDIEGLRAVAILAVVLYHADWQWAGGGFLGVDVFFVLSGFLIAGVLLDELALTGTISLSKFWARRARRLLPAAAVITLVALAVNLRLLTPFDQITAAHSARSFAVYASNILFAVRSTAYFGGGGDRDPLLHTWSLSVEEQFYLFFAPLLLALAVWSLKRGPAVFRQRYWFATAIVSLLSFVGCLLLIARYPRISFFILPPRAWEFGIGALVAMAVRYEWRQHAPLAQVLSVLAGIALLGSFVLSKNGVVQPLGLATLVPTLSTAVLIMTGAGSNITLVSRFLSTPPMRLLGRLSYSWYLWHWPALVYLREFSNRPTLTMNLAAVFLSLIPAAITYKFIESPIRFSKSLQSRNNLVLGGAVATAASLALLATLSISYANRTLLRPAYRPIVAALELPAVWNNGCHVSLTALDSPTCRFGPGTNDTTIVLYGDSHAAHWFPALDSVVKLRGWTLYSLTKNACPSVTVPMLNGQLGRRHTECEEWGRRTLQRIQQLRPTAVVISNTRAFPIISEGKVIRTDLEQPARDVWGDALRELLISLQPTGARLMVIQNNPHPGFEPSRCLARSLEDPSGCATYKMRGVDTVLAASERKAVSSIPGAMYANLNGFICDGQDCPVFKDGMLRYQDGNHISVPFARTLVPQWSTLLTQLFSAR